MLILFSARPLAASLEWEATRISQHATLKDDAAVAEFNFRNTGATTVTIVNVGSSCGCTVAALEKRSYAPGESGRIVATFTFGDRIGRQVKTVNVTTDEPGARPVVLTLDVEIPEAISIRPRFLLWRRGEEPAAKFVTLRVFDAATVSDLAVHPPDERFAARVEPTDQPGEYRIIVTPRDTELATNASLRLTARVAGGQRQLTIFAGVR